VSPGVSISWEPNAQGRAHRREDAAPHQIGVATALGHEGNVQKLAKRALEDGVSPDEIRQAVLLSTTTAGFPTMLAAMQWWKRSLLPSKSNTVYIRFARKPIWVIGN